jgi:PAS domain S-box-containing protein
VSRSAPPGEGQQAQMRQSDGSRIARSYAVKLLIFELAFLAAYYFEISSGQDGIARFWFADAVLLCGLFLSHPKEWWLYVLATVPIRFFLFVPPGTAPWFLFAGFATDSLKALLAAWLLRRASRDRAWFDSLREFGRYFFVAVVLMPGLFAFASAASYTALGHSFWTSYNSCFSGSALSSLVLAPFMLLPVITYEQRRKLRESEERFRSLVDVGPVMLWMAGTDARCTFFNKPWLDFTGLSFKEQAEQDWVVRVHPEDRERCVNKYLSAFKSRKSFTLEYRLLRNDGVYRWVLHNGVPRYGDDGAFLGYVGSRIDFTDRKEAEEHFRELSTQLLHAQEIERRRIGHELHDDLAQKLCALSMNLSRYSRECDGNGDLAAGLDELQQQLRVVSSDVVRLSRQLYPATVEGLVLSAALRNLCHQATDHKQTVLYVQNEDVPPLPENVSLPLYRIAEESLRNALTHSGATRINVELSASATTVRLSVRDNGCGFVVASNTKPGLGLSAMSERIRSSGGVFSIISNPGEGTAVVATMPVTESMKTGSTA